MVPSANRNSGRFAHSGHHLPQASPALTLSSLYRRLPLPFRRYFILDHLAEPPYLAIYEKKEDYFLQREKRKGLIPLTSTTSIVAPTSPLNNSRRWSTRGSVRSTGWVIKSKETEMVVKAATDAEDLEWIRTLQVGGFCLDWPQRCGSSSGLPTLTWP